MNTKQAKEIVPPEPRSTGSNFREVWNCMPRWLQIVVASVFILAGVLGIIFTKR
jgi:hypothetical protein